MREQAQLCAVHSASLLQVSILQTLSRLRYLHEERDLKG